MTMTVEANGRAGDGAAEGRGGTGGRLWRRHGRPHSSRSRPPWMAEAASSVLLLSVGAAVAALASLLEASGDSLTALRVLAIVVLAFIPGWLYVRFSGYRAAAVWDEYVLHLHRLRVDDPGNLPEPLPSSSYHDGWLMDGGARAVDAPNLYVQKFEAYYGKGTARTRSNTQGDLRARVDTLFPMVLTTVIVAVGWSAVLLGPPLPSGHASLADALRFGFMGAYSFVLQMLVRRFFQSDLRPSAYLTAAVRIVTVCILVTVVRQLTRGLEPGAEAAVVFLVGFFPLVGMQALQRVVAKVLRTTVRTLDTPYPLSDLDGLNVWNEARLLELGVEDMQNLVTANLVDLTLHTRIPLGRLVDWIDQAHLFLHLEPCRCSTADAHRRCSRETLRRYGIRTATDLEDAFRRGPAHEGRATELDPVLPPLDDDGELVQALRWVLDPDRSKPSATQTLLKTFEAEPNLDHVRYWKRSWRTGDDHHQPGAGQARPTTQTTTPVASTRADAT
jgi:hypothetical protein